MMIPAGPAPQPRSVDLPAGKYLFEAFLPDGEVAAETVTVSAGRNDPVMLQASRLPARVAELAASRGPGDTSSTWHRRQGRRRPAGRARGRDGAGSAPAALPMALVEVWKGAPPRIAALASRWACPLAGPGNRRGPWSTARPDRVPVRRGPLATARPLLRAGAASDRRPAAPGRAPPAVASGRHERHGGRRRTRGRERGAGRGPARVAGACLGGGP